MATPMAHHNSQGFQILVEAEKDADRIVQKGKNYRIQKLKDAKQEASKEIELLKNQKSKEFLDYEKQFTGSMDQLIKEDETVTKKKIEECNVAFDRNKESVINKLLESVIQVSPKIHSNALLKREQQQQQQQQLHHHQSLEHQPSSESYHPSHRQAQQHLRHHDHSVEHYQNSRQQIRH